jgi:hypothetical protein
MSLTHTTLPTTPTPVIISAVDRSFVAEPVAHLSVECEGQPAAQPVGGAGENGHAQGEGVQEGDHGAAHCGVWSEGW